MALSKSELKSLEKFLQNRFPSYSVHMIAYPQREWAVTINASSSDVDWDSIKNAVNEWHAQRGLIASFDKVHYGE